MLSIKLKHTPKNGETNKTLINNNTSFSGSFCLYAQKQKNPHKKNIFQPPKKWDRYQIVRKDGQNNTNKQCFMRDDTETTRNFATLGLSLLQPLFHTLTTEQTLRTYHLLGRKILIKTLCFC